MSNMARPFSGTGTALTIFVHKELKSHNLDYLGPAERERERESTKFNKTVRYFNALGESNGSNNVIVLLHLIPASYFNLNDETSNMF